MLNKLRGLMKIREGIEKEVINDIINMLDEDASDDEVQRLLEEIKKKIIKIKNESKLPKEIKNI